MSLLNPQEQADIVSILEEHLARARRGEYGAVCVVFASAQDINKIGVAFSGKLMPLALGCDMAHDQLLNLMFPNRLSSLRPTEAGN